MNTTRAELCATHFMQAGVNFQEDVSLRTMMTQSYLMIFSTASAFLPVLNPSCKAGKDRGYQCNCRKNISDLGISVRVCRGTSIISSV